MPDAAALLLQGYDCAFVLGRRHLSSRLLFFNFSSSLFLLHCRTPALGTAWHCLRCILHSLRFTLPDATLSAGHSALGPRPGALNVSVSARTLDSSDATLSDMTTSPLGADADVLRDNPAYLPAGSSANYASASDGTG